MSFERMPPAGPTWREPARPAEPETDRVLVFCRCGTDMAFAWPAGRDDVRCFACGARFPRPAHLPARRLPPWSPDPPRRRPTRGLVLLLLLTAIAAGLLGAAIMLVVRG